MRCFGLHRHYGSMQEVFDAAVQENIATFGQEVKPERSACSLPAQKLTGTCSGDCRSKRLLQMQLQNLSCRSGTDHQASLHLQIVTGHPDSAVYCRALIYLKW